MSFRLQGVICTALFASNTCLVISMSLVFYFFLRTNLFDIGNQLLGSSSRNCFIRKGCYPHAQSGICGGGDNGDGQKDTRRPLVGFEGITALFQRFEPSEG